MPEALELQQLLRVMDERRASDLHVSLGAPPTLRVDGRMAPLKLPALGAAETQTLCFTPLSEAQRERFERQRQLELSFGVKGLSRYRASLFTQRGSVSGVFRAIPSRVLTCEDLGLPPSVAQLAQKQRGLVLVAGPAGSGRSTTLAALVDQVNTRRHEHVVTIERPIEHLHAHKLSLISQQEVGADAGDFAGALGRVARQDAGVLFLGHLPDAGAVADAVALAAGRLVLAPVDALGVAGVVRRVLAAFPTSQQEQARVELSGTLQGVVSQLLLPRANGGGRALALEVVSPSAAVRRSIAEGKLAQIETQLLQAHRGAAGAATLNQALYVLCARRVVSLEDALEQSPDRDQLQALFEAARRK